MVILRIQAPDIVWQQADAERLPFGHESFDTVVCQFGVMFVPDKARAFHEARRVLRPGGTIAFNVWTAIDRNPVQQIAHETISGFFASNPPTFYLVPFSFHDEARICELLATAEFDHIRSHRVDLEARSTSAVDAARGLVVGNPVLRDVAERATASVEDVVLAVASALSVRGGQAPFRLPMQSMSIVARAA